MALKLPEFLVGRFSIAPTTLLVFRRLLCLVVITDLVLRFPLAETLIGRQGLLPQHPKDYFGGLYFASFPGAEWWMFAWTAAAASLYFFRVLPRASVGALFFGVLSLHARNPWILDGGDECLRWLLLWNLLLEFEGAQVTSPVAWKRVSWSSVGLLLQPILIYMSSVAHKLKGHTWREGSAVHDALNQSLWQRPLGGWIVENASVGQVLNYATLSVEFLAPLLLISPFFPKKARFAGLLFLSLLQLGIGLALRMNLFPWIMTLSLVPFLPEEVWRRLAWVKGRTVAALLPMRWVSAGLLVFSVVATLDSVVGGRLLPIQVQRMQTFLGLHQSWSMYSANPYRFDFGMEVVAYLPSGERVVLDEGRACPEFSPLRQLWTDYRAGVYLENLASPRWPVELRHFSRWLSGRHERIRGAPLSVIDLSLLEWESERPSKVFRTELLRFENEN